MKASLIFFVFVLLSPAAFSQQVQGKVTGKKKIVFIAGPDSHGKGEHEHFGGCTLLAKALNDSVPGVEAMVVREGWPKDESVLNDADAVVMYADGGGTHMAIDHEATMNRLTGKGTGLVLLHFTLEVPAQAGGQQFLKWVGGYFETNWSVNPVWEAHFSSFPDHPVVRGIKPFNIQDEWYYHLRFTKDSTQLTPLLQALPPESTLLNKPDGTHSGNPAVREAVLTRKEMQTLAWAYDRADGGRSFGFTGAHMHKNWGNDNFRKIVLNAIVWSAKMEVPKNGVPSATPTENELNALTKQTK